MKTQLITTLLILLALSACTERRSKRQRTDGAESAEDPVSPATPKRPRRVRTVLIQLDGLSAQWLNRWLKERRFLPGQKPADAAVVASGGLARLAAGVRARSLVPVDPSVTAPNLVTMLTGVFPARHGVVSNRFYRRGKRVNGFTEPIASATLWQVAPRQGLRTVTWAAVGTFCDSPTPSLLRTGCFASHRWLSRPQPAVDLTLAPRGPAAQLELRAGRRAQGTPKILLGVQRAGADKVKLIPPAGAVLRGGAAELAAGQGRDVLWSGGTLPDRTPAPRRLTRVILRSYDGRTGRARFYIASTAINRARPASFARTLDGAGVIRPPMADEHSFMQGRIDERLFMQTGLAELDAAVDLARLLGPKDTFDLAILYVGAVDSFGHQLLAGRKRQELNAHEVARYHATLERGLREVDRRLARLLDALDLARTRVLLASDHGMVPVLHDVSLKAALRGMDRRIRVITAAGAGFVHLPDGVSPTAVQHRLSKLRVAGRLVFAKGRVAGTAEMKKLGLPATAADLFVQASVGFSLSYRRSKTLTAWPKNQATHGYRSELPSMHGVFLAAGPGIKPQTLGPLHMTQVAAAVCTAVGIKPPKHARPGPTQLWQPARRPPPRPTGAR